MKGESEGRKGKVKREIGKGEWSEAERNGTERNGTESSGRVLPSSLTPSYKKKRMTLSQSDFLVTLLFFFKELPIFGKTRALR